MNEVHIFTALFLALFLYKLKVKALVQLFVTSGTVALCPWDSPGKNTGVGCHSVLWGIYATQGLNPDLLCFHGSAVDNNLPANVGDPDLISTLGRFHVPRSN